MRWRLHEHWSAYKNPWRTGMGASTRRHPKHELAALWASAPLQSNSCDPDFSLGISDIAYYEETRMDQKVAILWKSAHSALLDANEQHRLADEWWNSLSISQQNHSCGALLRLIFRKCCDFGAPSPPVNWSLQGLFVQSTTGNQETDEALQQIVSAMSSAGTEFADDVHEMGTYWPAWPLVGAFEEVPEYDPRPIIDSLIVQMYAATPAHHVSSAYCFISKPRQGRVPEAVALSLERAITRRLGFETDQEGQEIGSLFTRALLEQPTNDAEFAVRCMIGAVVLKLVDRPPVELLHAAMGMIRLAFRWPQAASRNVELLRNVLATAELPIEAHAKLPGEVRFTNESAVQLMQSLIDRSGVDEAALSLFLEIFAFTDWGLAEWPGRETALEVPVVALSKAIGVARSASGRSPLDLVASATLIEMVDRFGDGERSIIDGGLDLSLVFAGFAVYGAHTLHSAFHLDALPSARLSATETFWSALRSEGLYREAEAVFAIWLLNELTCETSNGAAYQGTVRFLRGAPPVGPIAAFSLSECLRSQPGTLLARVIENHLVGLGDGHVTSMLGRHECVKLVQDTLGSALWLRLPVHWKNTYIDMQLQWERLAPALNTGVDDLSGLVVGYAKLFESEVKAKFKLLSEEQTFREVLQRDFQLSTSNNRTALSELCNVLSAWRKGKISADLSEALAQVFQPAATLDALRVLRAMMPIRNKAAHTSTRAAAVLEARAFFLNPSHVDALLRCLTSVHKDPRS